MRWITYKWADLDKDDENDCDPQHEESTVRELPPRKQEACKKCSKGMSKDEHGNCNYCTMGKFQPNDLDDKPEAVQCQKCDKGTFAEMMFDQKEFENLPEWLDRQKCSTVTAGASSSSCLFH